MRKSYAVLLMVAMLALTAWGAKKEAGTTALKDFQPAGTTDKKHKKQQYDLTFATPMQTYTCRTQEDKKVDATQWVVGSQVSYQVQGNKGKIKNGAGKEVPCTIVRVAQ